MAKNLCSRCFHSYVCEQFNEHRDSTAEYTRCHFYNDHFVDSDDVEVVVHCGECKHYEPCEGGKDYCCWHGSGVVENDFCSYGERRDSDG